MDYNQFKEAIFIKFANEMPVAYAYHGLHHTQYVLDACERYIDMLNLNDEDSIILRVAALLHDIGLIWSYDDHEEASILYAREILPHWGIKDDPITQICKMVASTKIPQHPTDLLSQILCDADLDYLGTSDFYPIGQTLFKEFLNIGLVKNEYEFDLVQIKFLLSHQYHTEFAKKYREPIKKSHLNSLIAKRHYKVSNSLL